MNAFVQAPLRPGEELYKYLPPGHREDLKGSQDCKLKKSLYGLKQGSINRYLHLQEGLRKRGFRQSELDPGIYFSPTLVLITDEGNFDTYQKSNNPSEYPLTTKKSSNSTIRRRLGILSRSQRLRAGSSSVVEFMVEITPTL